MDANIATLATLEALDDMMALRDFVDEGPVGERRLRVLAFDAAGASSEASDGKDEKDDEDDPYDDSDTDFDLDFDATEFASAALDAE